MEVLTFIIMLINLGIALWNSYAVGYNSVVLQYYKGKFKDFFTIANSFGLVLAFAGAAYALSYFLSLILYSLGKISIEIVNLISAYSFLVFGTLIVFSGIVIAIESIIIASMRKDFSSIIVAVYNTLASIFNIYMYLRSFKYAYNLIASNEDEDNKNKALMIIIVAAIFAIILVYIFYKLGKEKAEKELG